MNICPPVRRSMEKTPDLDMSRVPAGRNVRRRGNAVLSMHDDVWGQVAAVRPLLF